ncbi:pectate lyase-like adhesive domain-containing protein [Enterococcus sp. LJL90]
MRNRKRKLFSVLFLGLLLGLSLFFRPSAVSATEVTVSDWSSFKTAYEDPNVTKIKLNNDIIRADTSASNNIQTQRSTSLEIDGTKPNPVDDYDHYQLYIGRTYLGVVNPAASETNATLHVHDVIISNYSTGTTAASSSIFGLPNYTPTDANCYTKNWTLRLGNIVVPKSDTERVARFTRGQVTIYGKNKVSTWGENFYTGGMKFEDGTEYYGDITKQNYSVIWYRHNTKPTDTGSSEFDIGANCDIKLRNVGSLSNTTYPAIYQYFSKINVGENSKFTATVPGSSLQFHGNGQTMTAENGSVVTLTSLASDISLRDSSTMGGDSTIVGRNEGRIPFNSGYATNLSINFKPGSSFFVIGSTGRNDALITLGEATNSSNNKITLDSPLQFDIRNTGSQDAVQVNRSKVNSFNVINSNLSFWQVGSDIFGNATFDYPDVTSFIYQDLNVPTSSETELQTKLSAIKTNTRSNVSRISGLNSKPDVLWQYQLTDADKNLSNLARIRLGSVPDNTGLDENGDLHYIDVFANSGLPVKVTDSVSSDEKDLVTDANGYISTTVDNFYSAGTILSAVATRGKLISDTTASLPVFDITPPEPVQINGGKVTDIDLYLKGEGAEAGANVLVKVNGSLLSSTAVVGTDGKFSITLPNKLTIGDKVTVYLQDDAGLAPTGLKNVAPATNDSIGNINPDNALNYGDATFNPAATYTVEKSIIDTASAKKSFTISSGAANVSTGEVLRYSVAVTNDEAEGSGILWSDVVLTDILDEGLDFDSSSADVQINGVSATSTFDAETRKLSVSLGDILPVTSTGENKIVLSFNVSVNRKAVGRTIVNTANLSGKTASDETFEIASNKSETNPILDNTLTVNFKNLDGEVIHEPVVISGSLNQVVDLTKEQDVLDAIALIETQNYQLEERPSSEQVTITGNGDEVTYVFDGILIIKSAPSVIDFGNIIYDSTVKRVDNPNLGNESLSILDTRSRSKGGWTLTAKLSKEMKNNSTQSIMNEALHYITEDGTDITLDTNASDIVVNPSGGSVDVSSTWGTTATTPGLKLVADPSKTTISNIGSYSAEITWTIAAGP